MNVCTSANACPNDPTETPAGRTLRSRLWFRLAENGGALPVTRCMTERLATGRRGCRLVVVACAGAAR